MISPRNLCEQNIKAVLLVGGLGTRLRSVLPSTPKPLASIGTWSFLEVLIRQLRTQGITRLVMCTGYLADRIEHEFGDGHDRDVKIEYSHESQPLGTGGALKLAGPYLSDHLDFFVMNGDSFLEVNLRHLMQFHREHGALATIATCRVEDASRYGTVIVDPDQQVRGFMEKAAAGPTGLINGGVYVFNREIFDHIPPGTASLERDVFPQLLNHRLYALEHRGMFIDIGTPQDYARAQKICDRILGAADAG